MTDKEIYRKIFEQAQRNGWMGHQTILWNVCDFKGNIYFSQYIPLEQAKERLEWHNKTFINGNRPAKLCCDFDINTYGTIIFTKEFAKAYFGKQEHEYINNGSVEPCKYCSAYKEEYEESVGYYCWQQHLSDMVLEKEPLKYLERFLE